MADPAGVELVLGPDADAIQVSVTLAPYVSVLTLLVEAVGGKYRGSPRAVLEAVSRSVSAPATEAVRTMSHPNYSMTPSCLVPVVPRTDVNVETQLAVMRSLSADDVAADIASDHGTEVPDHWAKALQDPHQWISRLAEAAEACAAVLDPIWRRARPAIDREIERVGVTMIRGGVEALLSSLTPRISCRDGILAFSDVQPEQIDLRGRKVVLVPMLAGPGMLTSNFDNDDMVWIGYPVSGVGLTWQGHADRPVGDSTDRLEQVLGAPRAALLRYLVRPSTMSEAARDLNYAPNTITFHCNHLEQAGLVLRERRGRSVRLSRTPRAERLLDVL